MVSPDWKWQPKDWRDQPLHILMGFWPPFLLGIITNSPLVVVLSIIGTIGYLVNREYGQHRDSGNFINLDLAFGTLGTLLGSVALFI